MSQLPRVLIQINLAEGGGGFVGNVYAIFAGSPY